MMLPAVYVNIIYQLTSSTNVVIDCWTNQFSPVISSMYYSKTIQGNKKKLVFVVGKIFSKYVEDQTKLLQNWKFNIFLICLWQSE